jgi:hypothetical protein
MLFIPPTDMMLNAHQNNLTKDSPNAVQPNAVQPNAVQPNAVQPNAVQPNAVQPNAFAYLFLSAPIEIQIPTPNKQ